MENIGIKLPNLGTPTTTAGLAQSQVQPAQEQLNQPQNATGLGMPAIGVEQGLAASGLPQQGNQQNGYQILGAPRII